MTPARGKFRLLAGRHLLAHDEGGVELNSRVRVRFWLEAGLACVCGSLAIVTLFWRDWIEAITGLDPDRHNGSFEWLVVAGLLCACLTAGAVARSEWRRPRAALAHAR